MQGRTLYGGASALIAYVAAIRSFPDLPPLRAAQIGFIAPIGAVMELRAEIVRQGRNVVQVRSEITCGGQVALSAFWLFGAAREPNASYSAVLREGLIGKPEDAAVVATGPAPDFIKHNFEIRHAADRVEPGQPLFRRWVKLLDRSGLDAVQERILVGDTLPPSAMRIMQRPGPLSSINWSFNVLYPATDPSSEAASDGWWLAEAASDHADEGYSSERLRLWNSDGQQMLAGMQSAAIFG